MEQEPDTPAESHDGVLQQRLETENCALVIVGPKIVTDRRTCYFLTF